MTYDLPQRLSRLADADTVAAATNAFLAAVNIAEPDRTRVQQDAHQTANQTANQIRSLADAMGDAEDADELYAALASLWLDLRLQWQRYNDVANYDLMRHGQAKPIDLVCGSVSSYQIERIESLLQPEQIRRLNAKALVVIENLRQDMASRAETV